MSLLDQAQSDRLLIPVEVPGGDPALVLLERIAAAVENTGTAAQSAGQKADRGGAGWSSFSTSVRTAADTFNEVVAAGRTVVDAINGIIDAATTGAAESDRLARTAQRLGLDWDQAAAAAGRFMDETEAMGAATSLAEAGIRLTQRELDALTRTAGASSQALGATTAEAIDRLSQGLLTGSSRALRPFGADMVALAGSSHSAGERIAALVEHASHIEPAVDSATDSVARFRDSLDDAGRTFSAAFVEGLVRLGDVNTGAQSASERLASMTDSIRAAGQAAAEVVLRVGNGLGAIVGALGVSIGTVLAGITSIGAGLEAILGGNIRGASAAVAAEFNRQLREGFARDAFDFARERVDALNRLADEGDQRTSMAAPSVATSSAATANDNAGRRRQGGGGGGARRERAADMTFTMEDAYDATGSAGAQSREATARFREGLRRTTEGRASEERGVDALLSTERSRDEAAGVKSRTAATREETAMLDRAAAREQQRFEERIDAQKSFTERWEEMHHHQFNASQELAEGLDKAFKSVGNALANHIEAVISGQETVGEALQNILADVLSSFSKEALMKGAFYTAEALAALVRYDFPGAATAGAAAAAYFAVGAAAGLGSQAIHTQPAASGGHASGGGGSSRGSDKVLSGRSASNDNAPPQVVNHYYAPVIGGRDATAAEVGARMNRFTDATGQRQTRERAA